MSTMNPKERSTRPSLLGLGWRALNAPVGRDWSRSVQEGRLSARKHRRGVALVMVMIFITILTATLAEFVLNTRQNLSMAANLRDGTKAYYLARSGVNLGRIIVHFSTDLNNALSALQAIIPEIPSIPLPLLSSFLMEPFNTGSIGASLGVDISSFTETEGLGDLDGNFTVEVAEECGLNIHPSVTRRDITAQVLLSILANPTYDLLFEELGPDGNVMTREEVVASILDYADRDLDLTDPIHGGIGGAGESDPYQLFDTPYVKKDYPYCSVEEIHMAHGVGDDLFTVLGPAVSVYGDGKVNITCASPELVAGVMLYSIGNDDERAEMMLPVGQATMAACTSLFLQGAALVRPSNWGAVKALWNSNTPTGPQCPIITKARFESAANYSSTIYRMTSEAVVGNSVARIITVMDASKMDVTGKARGALVYYREE